MSYETAFAIAAPVPADNDPVRVVGAFAGEPGETCPVRQEFFRLVWDAGLFEGVQTTTLADLFLEPNAPQCDYGGLFDPPSFAHGGRVRTRHEMEELERGNLLLALEQTSWKISGEKGAAVLLGLKPSTLSSRMRALGITRPGSS